MQRASNRKETAPLPRLEQQSRPLGRLLAVVWLASAALGCADEPTTSVAWVPCKAAAMEGEPCGFPGEICPCSGYQCPTYTDGYCTAICSTRGVWELTDCKRALPGGAGAAGQAGQGGEAGSSHPDAPL